MQWGLELLLTRGQGPFPNSLLPACLPASPRRLPLEQPLGCLRTLERAHECRLSKAGMDEEQVGPLWSGRGEGQGRDIGHIISLAERTEEARNLCFHCIDLEPMLGLENRPTTPVLFLMGALALGIFSTSPS